MFSFPTGTDFLAGGDSERPFLVILLLVPLSGDSTMNGSTSVPLERVSVGAGRIPIVNFTHYMQGT